jgi:S1-C subfamily serine protease/thiol-disulfide isomerase/thioredoxin
LAGRTVKCPKCANPFKIPPAAAQVTSTPAQANPAAARTTPVTVRPVGGQAPVGQIPATTAKPAAPRSTSNSAPAVKAKQPARRVEPAADLAGDFGLGSSGTSALDALLAAELPAAPVDLAAMPARGAPVAAKSSSNAPPMWIWFAVGGAGVGVLLIGLLCYSIFGSSENSPAVATTTVPGQSANVVGAPTVPAQAVQQPGVPVGVNTGAAPIAAPGTIGPVNPGGGNATVAGPAATPIASQVAAGGPPTVAQIIERVEHGIVLITVRNAAGQEVALGTGFVIDASGLVATNYHVMSGANTAYVQFRDGEKVEVRGYRAMDANRDLAVLELAKKPARMQVLKLYGAGNPPQGSDVLAIGHPSGFKFTVTTGIVSAVHLGSELPEVYRVSLKAPSDNVWIQTNAAISGGNSGGPLLNMQGEVLGINTWVAGGQNLGFATHIKHLSTLLTQIKPKVTALADGNAAAHSVEGISFDPRVIRLMEELKRAAQDFAATLAQARTEEELADLSLKRNPIPQFIERLFALADEARGTPADLQALMMICKLADSGPQSSEAFKRAQQRVLKDHLDDRELGKLIFVLSESANPQASKLLEAIEQKSSQREVRGMACFTRALLLSSRKRQSSRTERATIESLEHVIKDYGDVPFKGNQLGKLAEPMLFELKYLGTGKKAPDIEGHELSGAELKLSDYQGKVVVLDFFANWCPYCRQMYPLERLMVSRYANEPFALLGINCDESNQIQPVFQQQQITWHCWWDGPQGPITQRWNVSSFPTIYVLDTKGAVRYHFAGDPGPELEKAVQTLLDEAKGIKAKPEAKEPELKLASAMEMLQAALASQPPEAVIEGALKLLQANTDQPTKPHFQKVDGWIKLALKQSPGAVGLLMQQAKLRELQGRPGEAVKNYRQILKQKDLPESYLVGVRNNLAYALAINKAKPKELEEALRLINQVLKTTGPDASVLDTRAMVYWAQGKFDLARADLTEAIDRDEGTVAYFHLAVVEFDAGDKAAAGEALEEAKSLEFDPRKLNGGDRKLYDKLIKDLAEGPSA